MNQLMFCILGYISLSIINEYKYNPNNNIFKILSYYCANLFIYIFLRDLYNKNELKIVSLLFVSESSFYNFKSLYVFLNIFIDFVENKKILFYFLLILFYKDIAIFTYILFFNMLYNNILIPSIKLIIRSIKNITNDGLEIYLKKNIKFILTIYFIQYIFIYIAYILY